MTVESVQIRQPTGHKAVCALCCTRTPDEVRALRDEVAADVASGGLVSMTPGQVIEAIRARDKAGGGTDE